MQRYKSGYLRVYRNRASARPNSRVCISGLAHRSAGGFVLRGQVRSLHRLMHRVAR
jgi:hypothetical protein